MRALRFPFGHIAHNRSRKRHNPRSKRLSFLSTILVALTMLLPYQGMAAPAVQPQQANMESAGSAPLVTGVSYKLTGANFQEDRAESKEKSFKGDLTLPSGQTEATFTSDVTQAPIAFTDIGPYWRADTPQHTSVQLEMRTSSDSRNWSPWQTAEEEDIISPSDILTQTYASMISVEQSERTHRYVQSRVTLRADRPGISPTFHELTYTFINAGVTPNPPIPKMMAQGTPSDVPKPLVVSRRDWGSPQGESSPKWTPKYKRVTHITIHHTATTNADRDFAARVRAVWYFHTYTRGWGDIGYNYVIDPSGIIYEGRAGGDDAEAGHAYPFNVGTMGVGMLGNFMTVAPSAAAQAALIDLISWKVNQRGIDPLATAPVKGYTECGGVITYVRPTISGHRDYKGSACGRAFNTSTCPGNRLYDMLPQIRASVISEQPPLRALFTKHDTPGNLEPDSMVDVHLSVRNSGSMTWSAQGQGAVVLGYQWYTPEGALLKGGWKDIKTSLPGDVQFTESVTLTAKLNAPKTPGHYALVWDMFREGDGWFTEQGASAPLRVDVVVGKSSSDAKAPRSSVLPLSIYSNAPEITVRWAGEDEPGGTGLVSYDVQYRLMPAGAWTDWQSGIAKQQAVFEGEDGYAYEFRSRSRDAAGNVETWPETADAYTTIDTRPPELSITTPSNGAYVSPGQVVVTGRTEPGAFVVVNDKRASEVNGVYTSTVGVSGRDFPIHVSAADPAGNVSRLELTVQAASRYNDVPMAHPAFTAIEQLSNNGIMSGYNDGSFRPEGPMTRGQMAKVLTMSLRWNPIKPPEGRFTDVPTDSWMFGYVEAAAARGAMKGYPDGTFKPNADLARAEAIRSIVTGAGWKLSTNPTQTFTDVPKSHPDFAYVQTALEHGVIAPASSGKFNPQATATRADISIMVFNMIQDVMLQPPPKSDDGH